MLSKQVATSDTVAVRICKKCVMIVRSQASDTAEPAPAVKKMTLKRVPRVLVLHLSRFSHDQAGATVRLQRACVPTTQHESLSWPPVDAACSEPSVLGKPSGECRIACSCSSFDSHGSNACGTALHSICNPAWPQ